MKRLAGLFLVLGLLSLACSFDLGNGYGFGLFPNTAAVGESTAAREGGLAVDSEQGVEPWYGEDGQAIVGDLNTPRFSNWVGEYIVENGGAVVDYGTWYQGTLNGLTISWSEWGVENLKLGSVDGLYNGKAIFVAMRNYAEWTENSNVQHYEWVGTFIPSYSSSMSSWDVSNSTILQFDGTGADAFVVAMSEEWSQIRKDLNNVP